MGTVDGLQHMPGHAVHDPCLTEEDVVFAPAEGTADPAEFRPLRLVAGGDLNPRLLGYPPPQEDSPC